MQDTAHRKWEVETFCGRTASVWPHLHGRPDKNITQVQNLTTHPAKNCEEEGCSCWRCPIGYYRKHAIDSGVYRQAIELCRNVLKCKLYLKIIEKHSNLIVLLSAAYEQLFESPFLKVKLIDECVHDNKNNNCPYNEKHGYCLDMFADLDWLNYTVENSITLQDVWHDKKHNPMVYSLATSYYEFISNKKITPTERYELILRTTAAALPAEERMEAMSYKHEFLRFSCCY